MKLSSTTFENQGRIPDRCAFCVPDDANHVTFGPNKNPALEWSEIPEGTQSFALICVDVDVPTQPDLVNKEGSVIPKDLARTDFYHWVVINLPGGLTSIQEGECSDGVFPHGKALRIGLYGNVLGKNNYTDWFKGNADMEGEYLGYDGPCPPWNDERIHNYHFKIFALDLPELEIPEELDGPTALKLMEGHVLAEATLIGTYTLNPLLR